MFGKRKSIEQKSPLVAAIAQDDPTHVAQEKKILADLVQNVSSVDDTSTYHTFYSFASVNAKWKVINFDRDNHKRHYRRDTDHARGANKVILAGKREVAAYTMMDALSCIILDVVNRPTLTNTVRASIREATESILLGFAGSNIPSLPSYENSGYIETWYATDNMWTLMRRDGVDTYYIEGKEIFLSDFTEFACRVRNLKTLHALRDETYVTPAAREFLRDRLQRALDAAAKGADPAPAMEFAPASNEQAVIAERDQLLAERDTWYAERDELLNEIDELRRAVK